MTVEELKAKLDSLLGTLLNELEGLDLNVTSLMLDKMTIALGDNQQSVYELTVTIFFNENDNLTMTIRKIL